MAVIEVGCAVILRDGKLLVAQRNEGDTCGGYWEFPGGKKEAGESLEECLVREVREELAVEIRPRKLICRHDCVCPERTVALFFYFCDWVRGEPQCLDCQDARWVSRAGLRELKFPEGDDGVLRKLIRRNLVR